MVVNKRLLDVEAAAEYLSISRSKPCNGHWHVGFGALK